MPDERLTSDYRSAGFGGELGFGVRPALILVDLVRAYVDRASPLWSPVEEVVEAARRLLAVARSAQIPIAFTRVVYLPGGVDGGLFYKKVEALRVFDAGSPFGDFIDGLVPKNGEIVVTKQYASAFFGTSLAATLTSLHVDSVLIAGLTTSGCVRATAVDALQNGFASIIVREAVGDRDEKPHNANLFDMQAKYADVKSETQVTQYLTELER